MQAVSVRPATRADLEALVSTLVESHSDYAWEAWAVAGDDRAQRLASAFRTDLELVGLPHGIVTIADEGAAVAVWVPAGVGALLTPGQQQRRDRVADTVFGNRLATLEAVEQVVNSAPCPGADWYLATMGTHPDRQREGLGSAVLQPMLKRLDRNGQTARLETSTTGNVAFYERHGFDLVSELDLPHGAPTTWIMHRRPNGTA